MLITKPFDVLLIAECPVQDSSASDIIQIYFTSGTTGEPKMVPHTQGSYGYCHWVTGKYWLDLTPSDLHWNMSDTGWAKSAWSSVFAPWSQGAAVFVHGNLSSDHSISIDAKSFQLTVVIIFRDLWPEIL